jgi:hypothetical protein
MTGCNRKRIRTDTHDEESIDNGNPFTMLLGSAAFDKISTPSEKTADKRTSLTPEIIIDNETKVAVASHINPICLYIQSWGRGTAGKNPYNPYDSSSFAQNISLL